MYAIFNIQTWQGRHICVKKKDRGDTFENVKDDKVEHKVSTQSTPVALVFIVKGGVA